MNEGVPPGRFLGIERSGLPYFKIDRSGFVDTGYTCRVDSVTKGMMVTGSPSGIVSVGGYRFPLHELQEAVGRIDAGATLAALPDPLIGQRLIGNAANRGVVQAQLNELLAVVQLYQALGGGWQQ